MVTLVEAPRGLDMPVSSVALVDADDVRLGLAVGAGLGRSVLPARGVRRRRPSTGSNSTPARPAAIFVKEPTPTAVARAVALGTAVVAVDPRARWEHLYRLVNHAFEHHGDRTDPRRDSGTDLFGLAQSIADRTRGMVCIEDADSRMLAYSASSDEADELRRLTILGRAGPPEHLEWIGQWGIFDALRAGAEVVRVDERPELGLRPRLAVGVHLGPTDARRPRLRGHHLAAAGIDAAGRRRRGHPARRRGAGGADHVAAGGRADPARAHGCSNCSAWPATAATTSARSPASSASPPTAVRALVGFRGVAARQSRLT